VYQLFEYYKSLDVEHFSVLHFLIVHLKGREVENVFVKMLGDDNKKFWEGLHYIYGLTN